MTHKRPRPLPLAPLLLFFSNGPGGPLHAKREPPAAIMTDASAGVVQMIARNCRGQNRTGSGFLLDKPTQLVTALHVINGCRDIFAYFTGVGEIRASPRRTLPS